MNLRAKSTMDIFEMIRRQQGVNNNNTKSLWNTIVCAAATFNIMKIK